MLRSRQISSNNMFVFDRLQIQNADDVLITPLERFRKEQIGAAKVSHTMVLPFFFLYL